MIIDFHMHMFPDFLAPRAVGTLEGVTKKIPHSDGTLYHTLVKMRRWKVDHGVALHIATKPTQQGTINDWAASIQSDRISCFGSVHPDAYDAVEELSRIKKLGLRGIKLHPSFQNYMVDSPRMYPIYETAASLGLWVDFHTGPSSSSPKFVHCTSQGLAHVLDMFPKMKVISAHMGGCRDYDAAEEFIIGRNVYIDVSQSSVSCPMEQFKRMIRKHGAERVLFGSDVPWGSAADELEFLQKAKLSNEEMDLILYQNALRILDRPEITALAPKAQEPSVEESK